MSYYPPSFQWGADATRASYDGATQDEIHQIAKGWITYDQWQQSKANAYKATLPELDPNYQQNFLNSHPAPTPAPAPAPAPVPSPAPAPAPGVASQTPAAGSDLGSKLFGDASNLAGPLTTVGSQPFFARLSGGYSGGTSPGSARTIR